MQNCQFELKFGTSTNSNMQNSIVVFTFSVFKIISLGGILTNSNMHNLILMFIFFCFGPDIPFLEKFGPKYQNS